MNYWINTSDFSTYELVMTGIGWIFWISLYVIIARNAFKNKYIEMPWFCILTNISWEFIWGVIFYDTIDDIGHIFVYSYRAWIILDIFLIIAMFKFGHKQISIPEIKKYFVPISIAVVVLYSALLSTFIMSNFDHKWGSQSAYISNVVISVLYINQFLKNWKKVKFSKYVAWFKCLGTFFYTVVYFNFDPENIFVHTIGIVVFLIDISYIILLHKRQNKNFHPVGFEV